MITSFCACSSSSDETQVNQFVSIHPRDGLDTRWYEIISGQSSSEIELMCYNTVYTNSDSSDSLLVFTGVKNNKLWMEGYHADAKDWLANDIDITERKLPWQVTKVFSWVDSENINRKIIYQDGEKKEDSLKFIIPIMAFGTGDNIAIYYYKNYYGGPVQKGVKFIRNGKTIETSIDEQGYGQWIEVIGCYWWKDNTIYINLGRRNEYKYDCYSLDGQYQYTFKKIPQVFLSQEYGLGVDEYDNPYKFNWIDGTTIWSISKYDIIKKLGLDLGKNDRYEISYNSKESETVYIFNVNVQWAELYKKDENYKIRINVDTGELL